MPSAEKYEVRFEGRAITRRTRRQYAHALRNLLGPGYEVWNRYTRRPSN